MTETERHSLEQHMTKSLSVKVRGMKCMVESHYISNHDFLEVIINYQSLFIELNLYVLSI